MVARVLTYLGLAFCLSPAALQAQPFRLPTANNALFKAGGEEAFFVPTPGKPWTSGCFGCVRSDGWQMHEGLDIRCIAPDKRGEPTDPVMATADGTVVYVNSKSSLSNYGNYVVVKHVVDGIEVYSLYAHLSRIEPGIKAGVAVRAGQMLATMGHTSNTRQRIAKDRSHVHFELNLFVNDRFPEWFKKNSTGERNDHGDWNGQNLLGLDPRPILIESHNQGDQFHLLTWLRSQTELCRVQVRDTNFPWLKRYAALVQPNPVAEREGIAGYELVLNFNGVPFSVIPRAASELKSKSRFYLVSVNEAEYHKNPCRKLVVQKGSRWELGRHGIELLELLTY
ncbi:MAG: M23 family metallopeptidase [Verrucomicrobiota bacterium]